MGGGGGGVLEERLTRRREEGMRHLGALAEGTELAEDFVIDCDDLILPRSDMIGSDRILIGSDPCCAASTKYVYALPGEAKS